MKALKTNYSSLENNCHGTTRILNTDGRMTIPASVRKKILQDIDKENLWVCLHPNAPALILCDKSQLGTILKDSKLQNNYYAEQYLLHLAAKVKIDAKGRIKLPWHLLPHAEISINKAVIIFAVKNYFEIWSYENVYRSIGFGR